MKLEFYIEFEFMKIEFKKIWHGGKSWSEIL